MNFNYSYKAFVITVLLLGSLYLLFYFVKLSSNHIVPEEEFEIEYAIEELIHVEDIAQVSEEKIKIETHQVYSEAEEFIKESEANRKENSEAIEDKLSEINDAISDSKSERIAISLEKKTGKKKDANATNLESALATTNNSKSTNSYHLINRKVIEFPNPVYICESFGKVVLQIEVNANGYVIMTSVNKNTSTTTNLFNRKCDRLC
jgi:hypothetical protein